jgi:hypothetical protein
MDATDHFAVVMAALPRLTADQLEDVAEALLEHLPDRMDEREAARAQAA